MLVGCLLFADDIPLLSASVLQLQFMVNICYEYFNEWVLQFNVKKFTVMVVGKGDIALLPVMMPGDGVLNWFGEIKYLGVCLYSQKGLRVNSSINCRKFLRHPSVNY